MRFSVGVALLLVLMIGLSWVLYECHLAYGVRDVATATDAVLIGESCYLAAVLATAAAAGLLCLRRRGPVAIQTTLLVAILAICGVVGSGCFEEYYLRSAQVVLPWQCGVCVKCAMLSLASVFIGMMALWIAVSQHK